MSKKINLALLFGGISSEREVSLKSGEKVFEALDKKKYNITKYDPKFDILKLVEDAKKIDVALIILHGPFGEDGTIQGLLDLLGIPYQGAGVLGSSVAMNKLCAKQLYEKAGLNIAKYKCFSIDDEINEKAIKDFLGMPIVVKPVVGGSSIGITIVKSEKDLKNAIELAFKYDDKVMLEEYIKGRELTCGVLGNKNLISLPIVEIIPNEKFDFFNFEAKYVSGVSEEICPAKISDEITKKAYEYAQIAHKALFCTGYSRTDVILKKDKLYVLETNTIPGMTATSLLPQAASVGGFPFTNLLDKLIKLAMEK